jgi:hypothetical protein
MKDRQGRLDDAIALYQKAVQAHPNQAAVHNDLGLCLARRSRLDEAAAAIGQAIQLAPKEALYRNNIAAVLVEQGDIDTAFTHLVAVHSQAVAYYNVGFLLARKGQQQQAATLFAQALKLDPTLEPARIWLAKFNTRPAPSKPQVHRRSAPAGRLPDPSVAGPDLRSGHPVATPSARRLPTVTNPLRQKQAAAPGLEITAPEATAANLPTPEIRQLPPVMESHNPRPTVVPQSFEDAPMPEDDASEPAESVATDCVEFVPAPLPADEDAVPLPADEDAVPLPEEPDAEPADDSDDPSQERGAHRDADASRAARSTSP